MCVLGTAHGVVRVFGKIVAARPPTVWLEFLIKLSQATTIEKFLPKTETKRSI